MKFKYFFLILISLFPNKLLSSAWLTDDTHFIYSHSRYHANQMFNKDGEIFPLGDTEFQKVSNYFFLEYRAHENVSLGINAGISNLTYSIRNIPTVQNVNLINQDEISIFFKHKVIETPNSILSAQYSLHLPQYILTKNIEHLNYDNTTPIVENFPGVEVRLAYGMSKQLTDITPFLNIEFAPKFNFSSLFGVTYKMELTLGLNIAEDTIYMLKFHRLVAEHEDNLISFEENYLSLASSYKITDNIFLEVGYHYDLFNRNLLNKKGVFASIWLKT